MSIGTRVSGRALRLILGRSLRLHADLVPPFPSSSSHVPGPDPVKLLLFGEGLAVGYGVRDHDLALPGSLARALAAELGRGVDVAVATTERMPAALALEKLDSLPLHSYDAILLSLGAGDAFALVPPDRWGETYAAILDGLRERARPELLIVALQIPELGRVKGIARFVVARANRHAERLNEVLTELCAARASACITVRSSNSPVDFPTSSSYVRWSEQLVPPIAARLARLPAQRPCVSDFREPERLQALARLRILDSAPEAEFDRLAQLAQDQFGTAIATVTFIDGHRQWHKSRRGPVSPESPRSAAICDHTIRNDTTLVVPDTLLDERFASNPAVTGPPFIRFYAGYPLETHDGHRIGTLCVMDTEPREFSPQDEVMLRSFALMVQDLIWELDSAVNES